MCYNYAYDRPFERCERAESEKRTLTCLSSLRKFPLFDSYDRFIYNEITLTTERRPAAG